LITIFHVTSYQGIPCLHDEIVKELMWGMKRLMRSLVRREKSELPKEDCLPMSQGLQMLLSRYGFDVEPEMVSLPAAMLLLYVPSHLVSHFAKACAVCAQSLEERSFGCNIL
jgi:hypothetical protein